MESIFVPDPVISLSIKPTDKKNSDNFAKAIQRFTKEDPTFRVAFDNDIKETIASGMGELHLEIYAQRMEREYNCPVILGKPKVAFRETMYSPKVKYDYWHRKQTGGRGEYARIIGYMEPLPSASNTAIEFVDKTVGTNIPKNFIPAIRKAFYECCEKGQLSGHKVVGLRMVLQDGAHHEVDSSDWAFHQATQYAFEDCFEDGTWMILEPIMTVEVTAPEEFQGACVGIVTRRNGVIKGVESSHNWFTVEAEAPLNDMFGFSTELRSSTQGKGEYSMEYARYAPASSEVQDRVVNDYLKATGKIDAKSSKGSSKKSTRKNWLYFLYVLLFDAQLSLTWAVSNSSDKKYICIIHAGIRKVQLILMHLKSMEDLSSGMYILWFQQNVVFNDKLDVMPSGLLLFKHPILLIQWQQRRQ